MTLQERQARRLLEAQGCTVLSFKLDSEGYGVAEILDHAGRPQTMTQNPKHKPKDLPE